MQNCARRLEDGLQQLRSSANLGPARAERHKLQRDVANAPAPAMFECEATTGVVSEKQIHRVRARRRRTADENQGCARRIETPRAAMGTGYPARRHAGPTRRRSACTPCFHGRSWIGLPDHLRRLQVQGIDPLVRQVLRTGCHARQARLRQGLHVRDSTGPDAGRYVTQAQRARAPLQCNR